MNVKIIFSVLILCFAASAQQNESRSIQDNSFLLEEAYNQEKGVVQHISGFTRQFDGNGFNYSFTQEWPIGGQRHQFSFTVPLLNAGAGAGIGDVLLNYRFQLLGSGDTKVAIAPRASVILPTGDVNKGRGMGGAGLDFNVPVSVVLNRRFVTHWNAGFTIFPQPDATAGRLATANSIGQSTIWLARPNFNVMLENLYTSFSSGGARSHNVTLSPGVRWAYNFPSGLQIVPGIALPNGVGPDNRGYHGVFLYLSFEHPFGRRK